MSTLTNIVNRIIDSGIYPSILQNAKVSPIFKSAEQCIPTNHRPMSVLPAISKVIEKHISRHMYQYLAKTIFYMMPNLVLDQTIPVKLH